MTIKNKNFSFSLTQKVVSLCACLGILVIGTAAVQFYKGMASLATESNESFKQFSGQTADAIAAQFFERYGDVQAFATSETLRSGTPGQITDLFNRYATLYGIYDLILYVGTDGTLRASNDRDATGKKINVTSLANRNFANETWFKSAMREQYLTDEGKGYNGTVFQGVTRDPFIESVYHRDELSTLFVAPVKDNDGKIVGVVCNRANAKWIMGALEDSYEKMKAIGYTHSSLQLADSSGKLLLELSAGGEGGSIVTNPPERILKFNVFEELSSSTETNAKLQKIEAGTISSKEGAPAGKLIGFSKVTGKKFPDAIGWKVFIQASEGQVYEEIHDQEAKFAWSMLGLFVFVIGVAAFAGHRIGVMFRGVSMQLKESSRAVEKITSELMLASCTVESSSRQQLSTTQGTAASLSEMTSMVQQTTRNVESGVSASEKTLLNSRSGIEAMKGLTAAIEGFQATGNQLKSFSDAIEWIAEKTNAIHGIVFKTQLLSFNASIEAARAGESGRGFSVVADEMSELARKSEVSAREIDKILQSSRENIHSTLDIFKSNANACLEKGEKMLQAFNLIEGSIDDLNTQVRAIKEAANQQEKCIHAVNSEIVELNSAAQKNCQVSTDVLRGSQALGTIRANLDSSVGDLMLALNGSQSAHEVAVELKSSTAADGENKVSFAA